jgi:(E)-4-hydroxy-3-methylbut-2-enyl-diphosphate synthase
MVYLAGRTDHTIEGGSMIDHIVDLVERRAEAIRAEEAARQRAALAAE